MDRRTTQALLVVMLLAGVLAAGGAEAQEPAPASPPRQLIQKLGDPSYQVREKAAREIAQLGLAAQPLLLEALREPDLEIRLRAHQLLVTILQSDFEAQLTAFVESDQAGDDQRLPAWSEFRELVGNDRAARAFYVSMLRSEVTLLEAYDAGGNAFEQAMGDRIRFIENSRFTAFRPNYDVPTATLAALLFVTATASDADRAGGIADWSASQIYMLFSMPNARETLLQGPHAKIVQKLLETWIANCKSGSRAHCGLMLALNYDMDDAGLRLGRELLRDANLFPHVLPYAAIAVGRFGRPADTELLAAHLGNTVVCHTWSNPQIQAEPIRIQVRDVVLAMLLELTQQDPATYGFKMLERDPHTLYRIYTFGFLKDEEREAAATKWKTWLAANPVAADPVEKK